MEKVQSSVARYFVLEKALGSYLLCHVIIITVQLCTSLSLHAFYYKLINRVNYYLYFRESVYTIQHNLKLFGLKRGFVVCQVIKNL